MTARKTKSEQDEKTAGKDESKTTQTTEQAADVKEELPTKAEERGETDVEGAASGNVVGGVREGDAGLVVDKDEDTQDGYGAGLGRPLMGDGPDALEEVEVADGTVAELDRDGNDYDVPYVYLTAADLPKPRTSDSDDPARDWTAQHAGGERKDEDGNDLDPVALVPVQGTPGQTFRVRELPNRKVAEKAGIDYDQWVAGVPVRADVPDEAPRRGTPA